ncbi:MAG: helix-turn-helix domain-containing protein [Planctomycetota bacterium]|nr:helix-turn-helix domain-containing protein [Planctomycetota bacterium]
MSAVRTLSTSEFARALGLSESSVRRLFDTGDLGVYRTRGGHRRIPVSEAIRYVRATHANLVEPELLGMDRVLEQVRSNSPIEDMIHVLEEGHATAVTGLMQWLFASGMSVAELCDGPIAMALKHIGERWPHDKRAIFIEHRATILCERALNQLRLSVGTPDEDAPVAIGGAMSGEVYFLPTLMASLVLQEAEFNETNLGPNTPLDVLADAVIDEQPSLLWLSISEPLRSNSHRAEVLKLAEVAQVNKTVFIVGGRHASELASLTMGPDNNSNLIICNSMVGLSKVAMQTAKTLATQK